MASAEQKSTTHFYIELLESIRESLKDAGVSDNDARAAAKASCDQIRKEMGGFQIYIPVARKIDICARNAEIHCAFNGTNVREIARDFNLAIQTVYRILKESPKKIEGLTQ